MREKRVNIVTLCDLHVPYQSELAIQTAFSFCGYIQPEIIILHELHDFYGLSKFCKDPERVNKLQEELDEVEKYFWALRKTCPKSRIILLKSNHLDRLRKYLWIQATALSSLRGLEIENLLQLKDYNIEYMESFTFRGVLFKHGDIVRKFSSYTAKGEFEKEGMSGVTGHTHRLGVHYTTKRGGKYVWVESGCLCDLKPEYIDGTADWQQGLSIVTFKGDTNHFTAQVLPIVSGEIIYGDKIITI